MSEELSIKLFCFEGETLYEACDELFGLGNARIVGTEKTYSSIWVKIYGSGDALVDFYETQEALNLEKPTLTMSLAQCYLTYSKVNLTQVDLVVNILLHKVKYHLKRLQFDKDVYEVTAYLINVLTDPNELTDEKLKNLISEV